MASHKRASAAAAAGWTSKEIVPVRLPGGRGVVVAEDEGPGKMNPDKLTALRPYFKKVWRTDAGAVVTVLQKKGWDKLTAVRTCVKKDAASCARAVLCFTAR